MSLYQSVLRPALFHLSADRSHALALGALRWAMPWRVLSLLEGLHQDDPRLRVTYGGVDLPNPVGLAAGFDKNCELIDALSALGFGFLCVGSIMPEPRFGNPYPRIVRYEEREGLADSMGVPSKGRAYALERLRHRRRGDVPVFANVGGFSSDEIARGVIDVLPYVDAVEISLMCPNVLKDGQRFDAIAMLRGVLEQIAGHQKSVTVRVPNDTTADHVEFAEFVECCAAAGIGGLKVGGGSPVVEPRLGPGRGTLHGRDIFERALENVGRAASYARGRIPIKGNGGVSSASDVIAMRQAGAVCVDLYTAFIYQGWTVARDINRGLLAEMADLPKHSVLSERRA
jgi:dihydroorotate dehydrogenase (fumarate)/dihydroorotate dehydrogenase